ncbi:MULTISPECIES: hypothetical protein [Nostocales]|uniref:XRE family transcriptional regulator n=2 Tax=Nostocales TaxID=1161 RepID=A0ABW8WS65_9CYAN|nr:hypothetical protein [Tolypothrix bouteillei]
MLSKESTLIWKKHQEIEIGSIQTIARLCGLHIKFMQADDRLCS